MNLGELKKRIRNLGFEEDEAIEEYKEIILSAVNTALHTIAASVTPRIARYELHQDGGESGSVWYDMEALTGHAFLAFADPPVKTAAQEDFTDFSIEFEHMLVLDGSTEGDFSVFYKRAPERVTAAATDDTRLDVDTRMEEALPHLVAYYVWLDDDERKATQYYNLYDQMKADILAETQRPRARIIGGF